MPINGKSYAGVLAKIQLCIDTGKALFSEKKSGAAGAFRRALRQSRALLGDDHPTTVYCTGMLAACLYDAGDYQQALQLALEAMHQSKGPDGLWCDMTEVQASQAAKCFERLNMYEQACQLWTELAARWEAERGIEHGVTLYALQRRAICLVELGNAEEALPILQRALKACRKVYGRHERTFSLLCQSAKCLERLAQFKPAFNYWWKAFYLAKALNMQREQNFCRRRVAECQKLVPGQRLESDPSTAQPTVLESDCD